MSVTQGCNIFGMYTVCVYVYLALTGEQTYGLEFWHGGQMDDYLGHVGRSRSPGQKKNFFP